MSQVLELLPEQTIIKFEGKAKIIKTTDQRRLIGGYASVEVKDSQGETITLEALAEAFPKFMADEKYRNVHVMHSNVEVGKVIPSVVDSEGHLWESKVDDLGLFVVCEVDRQITEADRVWDAIEREDFTMFSIAGEAIHRTGDHGEIIDRLELFEITICPRGANPGAKFVIIKSAISTEIPKCVACGFSKSVSAPSVFIREVDGNRFLIFPKESQVRKDEIGASDSVNLLEQSGSEEQVGGIEKKLTPEPTTVAEPDKTKTADPAANVPANGEQKFDMQKVLEMDAHLVKLIDLLTQLKESAQAENKSEDKSKEAKKGENEEDPDKKTASKPEVITVSREDLAKMIKDKVDEVLKMVPPEKRTLVPSVGSPDPATPTPVDIDAIGKMGSWAEVEKYERERRAKARGGLAFP